MNFDDPRRIAESHLGKDAVGLVARQQKQGSSDVRQLVGASDIDFRPLPQLDQDKPQELPVAPKKKRSKKSPKAAVTSAEPERQPKQPTSLVANITKSEVPQVEVSHAVLPQAAVSSASERLLAQAITGEYRYAMLGLILGMSSILGGVTLCLHGVAGSTSWTAKLLGLLESKINDAAPGVVLFVVGVFFVVATRPKVKLDKLRG